MKLCTFLEGFFFSVCLGFGVFFNCFYEFSLPLGHRTVTEMSNCALLIPLGCSFTGAVETGPASP